MILAEFAVWVKKGIGTCSFRSGQADRRMDSCRKMHLKYMDVQQGAYTQKSERIQASGGVKP